MNMIFDFNTLYAIDDNGNILQEFNEMEDAANFKSTIPFKIVLHNKETNISFLVPKEELEGLRKN